MGSVKKPLRAFLPFISRRKGKKIERWSMCLQFQWISLWGLEPKHSFHLKDERSKRCVPNASAATQKEPD
jgi:hypothetical protein